MAREDRQDSGGGGVGAWCGAHFWCTVPGTATLASAIGAQSGERIMIEHYLGDNLPYYLGFLAVVVLGIVVIYFSRNSGN